MKRSISKQVKRHSFKRISKKEKQYDGTEQTVSTGSTLLDLAISGGRFHKGGIPSGIMVEIFGPSSTGKTVLLCEIAGNIQREGGEILFHDPEARLNRQFARLFGVEINDENYKCPDTVKEVFQQIQKWEPKRNDIINTVCADSLAALSTELEMESEDKMGMKRAKDFSEQLRKTCRLLVKRNILLLCSNQVRQNSNAGMFGQKYVSPGGEAIAFYSSLRLRTKNKGKIIVKKKIGRKEVKRAIGVETEIEVFKSSVWKPYRTANVSIVFDYGIDDIRENLKFIKQNTCASTYCINGEKLNQSLDKAIRLVEKNNAEEELKEEVIELWNDIESRFVQKRKRKHD